ncbi:carbohydrate kinase family protein [Candidatus Babeliales bacterium]|nr:carbohydrate kinase family protein [Candidatus Babeliales bacterium]
MKILTMGGATQDIYLDYAGADYMTITKKSSSQTFMLFETGEKIGIDELLYLTGGGATNSAASFKLRGFDVSCFCQVGTDNAGEAVIHDLENRSIKTNLIKQTQEHATGSSFIIKSLQHERTIFVHRGANSFLKRQDIPFDAIKECDQLYLTSLSDDSAALLPEIVRFAHEHNKPIAINPGSSQLSQGVQTLRESLPFIETLIMNANEARMFMLSLVETDQTYKKILEEQTPIICPPTKRNEEPYLITSPIVYDGGCFSAKKFFKEILSMGPRIVVITNGANGVYVATKNDVYFHPSIKIKVIDPVGAGDAFGSCFVASLKKGFEPHDALRHGILNSASVLTKIGAKNGILNDAELEKQAAILNHTLLQHYTLT